VLTHDELRLLLLNQDEIGQSVLGHRQTERMLRSGLEHRDDVAPTFLRMPPRPTLARMAGGRIPGLFARDLDFHVARWHAVEAARARRILNAELARHPYDVVHLHSHALAFALGALERRVPVALSVDAPVREWQHMEIWHRRHRHTDLAIQPAVAMERRALRGAAVVFAWSDWARQAILRTAPEAKVVIHHPGIDATQWVPAAHRPRERFRVLFVGGRFHEKGGNDLLEALADDLNDTVELDIVTPQPVASRPGVRVHRITGENPELLDLYQQADVVCLPTHGDAYPWVVLEAMACGTPVVATALGGIPDLLQGTGVLVERRDLRGTRDAVLALRDDPDRRRQLGEASRVRIRADYDARVQGSLFVHHLREATETFGAATPPS
jgi:glycosyltransferase involved in cell wall biosynthesis